MSRDCVLAIDQGTTASRAMVFGPGCQALTEHRWELTQHYPEPGWVEHDLEEIWDTVRRAVQGAVGALPGGWERIGAIGLTNQRETVGLWERGSGRPLGRAIVWQCRRTAEACAALEREAGERVRWLSGLTVDPYFSGLKLRWLLDRAQEGGARVEDLAAGTVDSWLLWKLTGGAHLTDPTNASRTMLYDIRRREWSEELLALQGVPRGVLARVERSGGDFGVTVAQEGIAAGVPIRAVLGDQQAALYGQGCTQPGEGKNTYGTGCFLLVNTGDEARQSRHGLLTTLACDEAGEACFALEGSVFVAGALVQWLRDGLGIISQAAEVEGLAGTVSDSGGVQVVPAFVGLGAPYWDAGARGAILGLTRGSGRGHVARACLEAIAHQAADVMEAMAQDGAAVRELRVDGGASANDLLMQLQADLAGVRVVRPGEPEMTAVGAARLAGLAGGVWTDELGSERGSGRVFTPDLGEGERQARREAWRGAVQRVLSAAG
jgi:glycerol kinase